MGKRLRRFLVSLFALAIFTVGLVSAQTPDGQTVSQDELDQLLAPIALYPDQLLTQILIASTYPIEVISAARYLQQNPDLQGDALDQAIANKNWDPSVQSLAAFPQVLAMMNDELEWMQRLGNAFLLDQQRVMDTVQGLRRRAQAAGNFLPTPQQSVLDQDGEILVQPTQPDVVYVPVYDPSIIYGPWWAPDYPPWFWYPPPIYGYSAGWGYAYAPEIYFGAPCRFSHHHWGWANPDWHRHHIVINPTNNRFWNRPGRPVPPPGGNWQHDPMHRKGIAYPDVATQQHFGTVDPNAVRARQDFRGRELVRPAPSSARPESGVGQPPQKGGTPMPPTFRPSPRPVTPAYDPALSRQQTQINSQRGMQSRQTPVLTSPATGRAPPAVSAPPAGSHAPSGGSAPRGGASPR